MKDMRYTYGCVSLILYCLNRIHVCCITLYNYRCPGSCARFSSAMCDQHFSLQHH